MTSDPRPINAHCKRAMEQEAILREIRKMSKDRTHPAGHDAGDEDPNAWSD